MHVHKVRWRPGFSTGWIEDEDGKVLCAVTHRDRALIRAELRLRLKRLQRLYSSSEAKSELR